MTSQRTYSRMCSDLTKLAQEQLKQLRARIDFLLQSQNGQESNNELKIIAFYQILSNIMKTDYGLGRLLPYPRFVRSSIYNKFKVNLEPTLELIDSNFSRKIERNKLYTICCRLLLGFLINSSIPVNISTITNNIHRIPGLLNLAFPGYFGAKIFSKFNNIFDIEGTHHV